ncbi:MAG: phosphoribosylanthranilate isomerase [Gemmataceae bacterium]|nr:phosphoribosylanthranilate isomerase [Gemmataceae bacterium]
MTRVKVCGLTNAEDVRLCVAVEVDALGFVVEFPTPVPWNLPREQAATLMAAVPPFIARVAVVSGDATTLVDLARKTGADVLQLHGDETPETVGAVVAALRGTGVRVVKALRIPGGGSGEFGSWLSAGDRFVAAGAAAILLDPRSPERPGGTGLTLDRTLAASLCATAKWPAILAGGLTAETVAEAVARVRPYGVDVLTGVEDAEHRKVPARVRAFVAAVRAQEQRAVSSTR